MKSQHTGDHQFKEYVFWGASAVEKSSAFGEGRNPSASIKFATSSSQRLFHSFKYEKMAEREKKLN